MGSEINRFFAILHVIMTIKGIFRKYYINDVDPSLLFIVTPERVT
jgi:hypothetical protein